MIDSSTMAVLADVLSGAPQVYVGVSTKRGPHVTPELFVLAGERIVCVTAAGTVKSRRLRRNHDVACAARSGTRLVSVAGKATVLDPASPATLIRAPRRAATVSLDAARYTASNLAELAGAAIDLLAGRLGGPIPPHRVVIIIEPAAAAVIEGTTLRHESGWAELQASSANGEMPASGRLARRRRSVSRLPPLNPLPAGFAELVEANETVVGWTRADGRPLTIPAAWNSDDAMATVSSDVFRLMGAAARSPACVAFDAWTGYGPSGKQGLMLRGTGVASRSGAWVELRCDVNRATYWDGTVTNTVAL